MAVHTEHGSSTNSETAASHDGLQPDELWDLHSPALFAMACALLGGGSEAPRAVSVGLMNLYEVPDPQPTLRCAARSVYQECKALSAYGPSASITPDLPLMTGLREVAWFQRSALALCLFGGHTYREAATELGIPADSAAWLLLSGLQELGRLTSTKPSAVSPGINA